MNTILTKMTLTTKAAIRYLIAPPFCAHCKQFLYHTKPLCQSCTLLINPVVSTTVSVTKKYSVKVFAISGYAEPLKSLILAKRWSKIIASTQLGELIWDMTYIRHTTIDYIVPIPLHWTRYARRGYNQADEIAQVISQKSDKPLLHLLNRTKKTLFQSSIAVKKRHANLHNAFDVHEQYRNKIENKHILLVDDLLTTGATLISATRELIKYKPASITAVVACRIV